MRLLVFGSRKWTDKDTMVDVLDTFVSDVIDRLTVSGITLVEGEANGADKMARGIWELWMRDFPLLFFLDPFPARWTDSCPSCYTPEKPHRRYRSDGTSWCPAQGPIRNQQMLDSGIDKAIGFQIGNSGGTQDMHDRLVAVGIEPLMIRR